MDDQKPTDPRKTVFKDLLEAQDRGMSVAESRALVTRNHDMTVEEVVAIERVGIDEQWPPL